MTQYSVTGMSCAACSARVEKAVSAVPGVTSCAVSLLTNSMGVDGTAAPADIVRAVENAGYGASLKGAKGAAPAAAAHGKRVQNTVILYAQAQLLQRAAVKLLSGLNRVRINVAGAQIDNSSSARTGAYC